MYIRLPPTEVPCPYCGRGVGEWCKNWKGIRRDPHAARKRLTAYCRVELKRAIRWHHMDEFRIFCSENNFFSTPPSEPEYFI